MGAVRSKDNIAAFTACAYGDQDVAFSSVSLYIAREDLIKTVVVSGARDVPWIANGDRGHCRPVSPETTRQLFGKVHRVAHRSAISAAEHAISRQKSGDEKPGRFGNGCLGALIGPQCR